MVALRIDPGEPRLSSYPAPGRAARPSALQRHLSQPCTPDSLGHAEVYKSPSIPDRATQSYAVGAPIPRDYVFDNVRKVSP
jgi:hypothetical protein